MKRDWAAICDRCGFRFHSYKLKKEWDGLMVCKNCWEPRHPQDFVRVPVEEVVPPWTRPEQTDTFTAVCYLPDSSGYAGLAHAGCMIAGNQRYTVAFLTGL
jgi:hypothetical protein